MSCAVHVFHHDNSRKPLYGMLIIGVILVKMKNQTDKLAQSNLLAFKGSFRLRKNDYHDLVIAVLLSCTFLILHWLFRS